MIERCIAALEVNAQAQDIAVIDEGIAEFNRANDADDTYTSLTILLRNEHHEVVGGLMGGTYWGMLAIDIIWLAEPYRRQGYGQEIVALAEEEALRRGCHRATLESTSFQAVPFYEKLGYHIFGKIEGIPPGRAIYYLEKTL